MKMRFVLPLALLVSVAGSTSWPGDQPSEAEIQRAISELATLTAPRVCNHTCIEWCWEEFHSSQTYAGGDKWQDEPYGCALFVGCPNPCIPEEEDQSVLQDEDLQALWSSAAEGDLTEMARWLEESSKVTLNADRSAIQVEGCNGHLIAHIPLSSSQLVALVQ